MKKVIMIIISTLMYFGAFSQQLVSVDNRLRAKYSDDALLDMQQNRPDDLEYFTWFLDNAYVIKEVGFSGTENLPKLRYFDKETKLVGAEVTDFDEENFNIMEYDIEIYVNESRAYLIGNTGKALVLLSNRDLTEKYNKYRRMHYENN